MKIASWNVNSLKVRLPHVLDWLNEHQPDVLGLQEIKSETFPSDTFSEIGYHAAFNGQKTYNGVALLSKQPAEDCLTDLPHFADPQRRIIAANFADLRIINLYVPNGSEVGSEKYAYKLQWLEHITAFIQEELEKHPRLAIMGDFNITPDDRDVYDPKAWHEKILCSTPERQAFQTLLNLGFSDAFRLFEQAESSFTWWDYRQAGFRRNLGMRIDHILCSAKLSCVSCQIDKEPRKLERPSDHTPIFAEFLD